MLILKELFLKRIAEAKENETAALVRGGGDNYSEVQLLRGRIHGVEWAEEAFNEIWDKLMNSPNGLDED